MANATLAISPGDLNLLMAQLPVALLGRNSGMSYDGVGTLTFPAGGALQSAITSIMANTSWRTTSQQAQLMAYAQAKQAGIVQGGISVNIGTTQAPQNVEASTDPTSLIMLQGAYAVAQANGSATFQWVQSNGTAVTLTAAQITTIFNAVTAFVQSTFTQLAAVIAAIATSTITTTAQVDTPPSGVPAWPANS